MRPRNARCARLAASVSMALALSAGATIAHAQDAGDTDTTDDTDAADTTDAADAMRDATRDGDARREGKAQDARREGRARTGTPDVLAVAGRVHVRDTITGVDLAGDTTWLDERTLDSARVSLSFRPNARTRMDLEVDFAGDQAELKDTFIRYRPAARVAIHAGRFKRPVSFVAMTSTWDLPRIDRGLLSELRLDDRRLLFAGGRGDGVMLEVDLPAPLAPRLSVAMHESDLADDLGLPLTDVNQDVFARLEVAPAPALRVAVAGGSVGALGRLGERASYRHRAFATVEASLETAPVRAWAEVMAGRTASTYVDGALAGDFVAAQALVAPRHDPPGGLRLLEPFAAAGWLDPSTAQADDELAELTAGAALWMTGKLRLQLEGGRRFASGPLAPSADATIIRIQLGAAFDTKLELP